MLIAQGLGEYGSLSGGGSSLVNLVDNLNYAIRDAGPGTWMAGGFALLIVWFFFLRAR